MFAGMQGMPNIIKDDVRRDGHDGGAFGWGWIFALN